MPELKSLIRNFFKFCLESPDNYLYVINLLETEKSKLLSEDQNSEVENHIHEIDTAIQKLEGHIEWLQ